MFGSEKGSVEELKVKCQAGSCDFFWNLGSSSGAGASSENGNKVSSVEASGANLSAGLHGAFATHYCEGQGWPY